MFNFSFVFLRVFYYIDWESAWIIFYSDFVFSFAYAVYIVILITFCSDYKALVK